jgi:hypothetical protein
MGSIFNLIGYFYTYSEVDKRYSQRAEQQLLIVWFTN